MRYRLYLGMLFMIISLGACQAPKVIINYYAVPSLTPGTLPEMNTAGFWIGRHSDPDAVVMTGLQIADFNAYIKKKTKARRDIAALSESRDGKVFRDSLQAMLAQNQGYVDRSGKAMSGEFISSLEALMGIGKIPSAVTARFGYVVKPSDQRLLPTAVPFYKSASDTAIDRLQNNALDVATPVLVLHETTDRAWAYVISPDSEGWVPSTNVALCGREEMARYEALTDFVVTVDAKTDLYADPWLRQHRTYAHMGVRLPVLLDWDSGVTQVLVPTRADDGSCGFDASYVSRSQVNRGYLPYTPRNAYQLAFRLLNAPYGWGGMYGEQDCSRFVQEVFAAMGVILPRNSSQQGRVGRLVASFSKANPQEARLKRLDAEAPGGITTLQFPGHIMLYLGSVDGRAYAIHDLFAYAEQGAPDDRLVPVNRVVVSSLDLGDGTKKGSLLMRLGNVREISPEPGAN
jgi:hypothetical protein